MWEKSGKLFLLLASLHLAACSTKNAATIPSAVSRGSESEQVLAIGAASERPAAAPGEFSAVVADTDSTDRAYSFARDVKVYRHKSLSGDYIEFHGKTGATFYPANRVRRLTVLSADGTQHEIAISRLLAQRSTHDTCQDAALDKTRSARGIADCTDPGPCADCSGPMAPGGWLACEVSHCGGVPEFGTGFGIGLFRSVDPQLSCEFNFADGSYQCYLGAQNTDSTAPVDLSNGYTYSEAMGAALLHCKGPPQDSEAFVVGKHPDARVGINLGFSWIPQGRAVAHSMITKWRSSTSMSAQYWGLTADLPVYVGWCSGAN